MQEHLGSPTTATARRARANWVKAAKSDHVRQALRDLISARDAVIAQKVTNWQERVHMMFIYESKSCSDVSLERLSHERGSRTRLGHERGWKYLSQVALALKPYMSDARPAKIPRSYVLDW